MRKDPNPPRRVGDILGEIKLIPDIEAPEPRKQQCGLCHLDFLSRPQWFGNKWVYPNVCTYCGDNYSHTEELRSGGMVTAYGVRLGPRTELDTPLGMKRFDCNGCSNVVAVQPVKEGAYWVYYFHCPRCGAKAVNLYHAYKRKKKAEVSSEPDESSDD